jgi:hypothetical protein
VLNLDWPGVVNLIRRYPVSLNRRRVVNFDSASMLFPETGGTEMVELYAAWRKEHFNWWFDKWFHKSRRNPADEIYM